MIEREHKNSKITGRDNDAGSLLNKDANDCIIDWNLNHKINRTDEKTIDLMRILLRNGKYIYLKPGSTGMRSRLFSEGFAGHLEDCQIRQRVTR